MELFTLEQQKERFANIKYAEENVLSCQRRHRVHEYIPGQVIYNLGEYPARFSIRPTEYDYNLIKSLSEKGVGLIQIHEEWNDSIRHLGADKYTSHDPEGLKEFIKLCHQFNIKIIPYISNGYFDGRDPDFKECFTRGNYALNASYYRYRLCSPASPEWNEFFFKKINSIMDEYEFDGLFNDMGYDGGAIFQEKYGNERPFEWEYDPYIEDMLSRLYSLVKERNGIMKIHQSKSISPNTNDKVYDYLWVGECVDSSEELVKTRRLDPYVVVCPDFRFMKKQDGESLFAKTMPFMQFTLRVDGRPVTAERVSVPGIEYVDEMEKLFFDRVQEYNKTHPNGPYVYSEWSDVPDDVQMREQWFDYLALYKSMVKENSVCFIDIGDNKIVNSKIPKDVHVSLFINEDKYLCISNLGTETKKLILSEKWIDRQSNDVLQEIDIASGSIKFLKIFKGDSIL